MKIFRAIVTVNLTSLLVLTTLFISVSSSLPQTAYIKMVDVWLIFAQVVPWIYVLLHTLIDWMRPEEGRDINHHGKSITVRPMQDTDTALLVDGVREGLPNPNLTKSWLCQYWLEPPPPFTFLKDVH